MRLFSSARLLVEEADPSRGYDGNRIIARDLLIDGQLSLVSGSDER
jgi:hypothetical protein